MAAAIKTQFLDPLHDALKKSIEAFEAKFCEFAETWDKYSFRTYLAEIMNYPTEVIDFIETVHSQTNQFSLSVEELLMQNSDFGNKEWTIDKGMSRLPEAMGAVVGIDNITFDARVTPFARTASSSSS